MIVRYAEYIIAPNYISSILKLLFFLLMCFLETSNQILINLPSYLMQRSYILVY